MDNLTPQQRADLRGGLAISHQGYNIRPVQRWLITRTGDKNPIALYADSAEEAVAQVERMVAALEKFWGMRGVHSVDLWSPPPSGGSPGAGAPS